MNLVSRTLAALAVCAVIALPAAAPAEPGHECTAGTVRVDSDNGHVWVCVKGYWVMI